MTPTEQSVLLMLDSHGEYVETDKATFNKPVIEALDGLIKSGHCVETPLEGGKVRLALTDKGRKAAQPG